MKTTQSISCMIPIAGSEYFTQDIWLPENQVYTLLINYPFNRPTEYPIKTGKGMGLAGLVKQISKCYVKKYKDADKGNGDGYWHVIGDLVIEGIEVNHKKKTIRLSVGS